MLFSIKQYDLMPLSLRVLIISPSDAILWWGHTTELEEFVDKTVRGLARADREGKHARRHNKKARDFTDPFIHKSTLLSSATLSIGDGVKCHFKASKRCRMCSVFSP